MDFLLKDILGESVFLEYIKITGPKDKIHLISLEEVLTFLNRHNMRVNFEKCQFFQSNIDYCEYRHNKDVIYKIKSKIEAIQNRKRQSNKDEVRAFACFVTYYGRLMSNLSS